MSASAPQNSYEFGNFRMVPAEGLLLRDDQQVALTPKAFHTLLVLIERRGHLVQKSELLDEVWGDAFVEENAVSKTIWAVRTALLEDPRNPRFIQTVPKRGYRFVGDVTEVTSDYEALSAEANSTDVREGLPSNRNAFPALALTGFAVIILILAVGWRYGAWFKTQDGLVRSLTVLPLENLSGDPSEQYLVDGVTEFLSADLSRISELTFISLPTEIRKQTTPRDPKAIGTKLDVDAVLTGSVARSGEHIRVAVQLIHSATGKNLWANTYERELRDIQALQKEIARSLAGEIRTTLSPKDIERLRVRRAVDPNAYDQYLRARYYLNLQNRNDQETAIIALEKAVEIDPSFANAYAELALAYTWTHFSFSPEKTRELAEKAYVATERALLLEPELPQGYLARGRLRWTPENRFPHEMAISDYRQALSLDPKLDEARNQLALVYCHVGFLDEALQQAYEGVRLNPTNNLLQLRIGQSMNSQGRFEEALAVLRGIPTSVHPSMIGHQTAWALFNLGKTEEAAATVDQFLKDNPDAGGTFASIKAVLAASAGQYDQAENLIKDAIEKGKGYGHFHHTAYTIACAYSLMNKPEEAIKYLQMAADTGFPCYPSCEIEPSLNNLRQDPRFTAFMSQLKARWQTIRRDTNL